MTKISLEKNMTGKSRSKFEEEKNIKSRKNSSVLSCNEIVVKERKYFANIEIEEEKKNNNFPKFCCFVDNQKHINCSHRKHVCGKFVTINLLNLEFFFSITYLFFI
jgi:hypothetical protein